MLTPRAFAFLLIIGISATCRAETLSVTWSDQHHATGPDNGTTCLIRWQGDVVVAGRFGAVGPVATSSHVARLRDGVWQPVGGTIPGSEVVALAEHDGALHAIAKNGASHQVVRFDGEQWLEVGGPCPPSTVIASFQGDLYVGPHRLEGDTWVDRLQTDDVVRSLVVMGDMLVAGGGFTSGAGVATGHVLGWDGATVVNAFAGQEQPVADLEVWNGQLHAARSVSYPSAAAVQVWQDSVWVDIPELGHASFARHTTDLAAGDGRLLLCGYWEAFLMKADSEPSPDRSWWGAFARAWDGSSATALNEEEGFVEYWQILDDGDHVLVGGGFATPGQPPCANLGRVIDGAMTPVCATGLGASDRISTLQVADGTLIAGGSFASIGALFSRNVAVLEPGSPENWSARDLGNGEELGEYGSYHAVGGHSGGLYVIAGGHQGQGAGYWSGGEWHMTVQSWDYPICDELLSLGGMLLGDGGWDGVLRFGSLASPTSFAAVDRRIIDIATSGADLIVGGEFESIEGVAAANIAIRTAGAWQALGGGLPHQVRTVGSWEGRPVAATSTAEANGIYVLDHQGDGWVQIGTLAGGVVTSFAELDGLLFVGGSFSSPADDGTPMVGLACWTGSQWHSVGNAANVNAMAVQGDRLWLGGTFHVAGGVPAWHLTSLVVDAVTGGPEPDLPDPVLAVNAAPNPFNPQTWISFDLPAASDVRLDVFDARGRRVVRLLDDHRAAGAHKTSWDGRGEDGRDLPSGVYLLKLEAGRHTSTVKMTLAR